MWQPQKKNQTPPKTTQNSHFWAVFFVLFLGRFPNKIINAHIVTRGKLILGGQGVISGVWGLWDGF